MGVNHPLGSRSVPGDVASGDTSGACCTSFDRAPLAFCPYIGLAFFYGHVFELGSQQTRCVGVAGDGDIKL